MSKIKRMIRIDSKCFGSEYILGRNITKTYKYTVKNMDHVQKLCRSFSDVASQIAFA